MCQGHPQLAPSGMAVAAHALFQALDASVEDEAWFLGCHDGASDAGVELRGSISQPFGPRDYVGHTTTFDGFRFAQRDPQFLAALRELLADLRPDILHVHGFDRLGVDILPVLRQACPEARIVLSLNRFDAICAHDGSMLTRPAAFPCAGASSQACSRCFPEHGPTGFFLRTRYIRHCLDFADHLVVQSTFQRQRFLAWGISASSITHMPPVIAVLATPPQRREPDGVLRIGVFGRLSPLKGLNVVVEAARLLQDAGNRVVRFDLHGSNMTVNDTANIRVRGPYAPADVDRLMCTVDAVLVASIAAAAAPMVVAEARRNGIPVLCADTPGLIEAVQDGVNGLHFPSGDAQALVDLLERLAALPYLLTDLAPSGDNENTMTLYRNLYQASPAS